MPKINHPKTRDIPATLNVIITEPIAIGSTQWTLRMADLAASVHRARAVPQRARDPPDGPKPGPKSAPESPMQTRMQTLWSAMKQRCYNPKHTSFRNYGGRGIKVYEPWRTSRNQFEADIEREIGAHPGNGWSLDRIRNNEDYEPGNVRWASKVLQMNNSRINDNSPALQAMIDRIRERP